jgi:hypothetical protein
MKYLSSFVAGLGLAVLAMLASTTVALGKEGLRASPMMPIPATASPGDEIAWTLTDVDPATASKPVPASANAATGVPALGSFLGPICLAGLSAVGMAGRRRVPGYPPA